MSSDDLVYVGITELVLPHESEHQSDVPLDVVHNAALWIRQGRVQGYGPEEDILKQAGRAQKINLGHRAVVPGFVDSHTHIVFAGTRIDEMARRARGETYEQIAAAGGGIANSVAALQRVTRDDLVAASLPRLKRMLAHGTTTCEIKTGYGLLPAYELMQLQAIAALQHLQPIDVVATVLAHIVPPEMRGDRQAFVRMFCDEVIAKANGLARFCDVFVEHNAFTPEEAKTIAQCAREQGLQVKLHVDQLSDGNGAALAAEVHALSADHLEMSSKPGLQQLAARGVVATLLPGCGLFLGKGPWPDGRAMRDAGCEVAVATDFNPGSSHIGDLALCGTLAMTRCGLTMEEALWGITRGGAKALGLLDRGTLHVGERADFVVLDHRDWRALFYSPGDAPIHSVAIGGSIKHSAKARGASISGL